MADRKRLLVEAMAHLADGFFRAAAADHGAAAAPIALAYDYLATLLAGEDVPGANELCGQLMIVLCARAAAEDDADESSVRH